MTKLIYLQDSYKMNDTAQVVEVINTEKGPTIILDQTIFYPQGGGQPADQGSIMSGQNSFQVSDVRLQEDGTVHHYGLFTKGEIKVGDTVKLHIDADRRLLNAKIHSAGHLIDIAISALNITSIKPTKGFHFPEGAYVEYAGTLENAADYIPQIEAKMKELIAQNMTIETHNLLAAEAQAQGIWAPPGKSARIVNFAGYEGCGCGGTHIRHSGEIGEVKIRKISSKKGVTRVGYEVLNS